MIKARRHIDFFRPGDEIPDGYYDPATLDRLIEKGLLEVVDVAPSSPVTEPEPAADVGAQTPKSVTAKVSKKQRL